MKKEEQLMKNSINCFDYYFNPNSNHKIFEFFLQIKDI
jgi:hypothetical protein